MNQSVTTDLPRVQLHAGAYAGCEAQVLQARLVADDDVALLVRFDDGDGVMTMAVDFEQVTVVSATPETSGATQ
jgi:hypothetical protein